MQLLLVLFPGASCDVLPCAFLHALHRDWNVLRVCTPALGAVKSLSKNTKMVPLSVELAPSRLLGILFSSRAGPNGPNAPPTQYILRGGNPILSMILAALAAQPKESKDSGFRPLNVASWAPRLACLGLPGRDWARRVRR